MRPPPLDRPDSGDRPTRLFHRGALVALAMMVLVLGALHLGSLTWRFHRQILLLQGGLAGVLLGGAAGYVAGRLQGPRR